MLQHGARKPRILFTPRWAQTANLEIGKVKCLNSDVETQTDLPKQSLKFTSYDKTKRKKFNPASPTVNEKKKFAAASQNSDAQNVSKDSGVTGSLDLKFNNSASANQSDQAYHIKDSNYYVFGEEATQPGTVATKEIFTLYSPDKVKLPQSCPPHEGQELNTKNSDNVVSSKSFVCLNPIFHHEGMDEEVKPSNCNDQPNSGEIKQPKTPVRPKTPVLTTTSWTSINPNSLTTSSAPLVPSEELAVLLNSYKASSPPPEVEKFNSPHKVLTDTNSQTRVPRHGGNKFN